MNGTALLVIDIQQGAFDGALISPIDRPETFVESAVALVSAARAGEKPVIFIQHCDVPGELFEKDSAQWKLHPALVPQPGEKVICKHQSSAFDGTDLGAFLNDAHVRELVVCGLQSEYCISNTTKGALAAGYAVAVARDAHRTWPSDGESAVDISERVNADLHSRGATLESTAALADSLRRSNV